MDDGYQNRRAELLYLARKTRLQWIAAAEDASLGGPSHSDSQPAKSQEMESMLSALPAMHCLEDVLGFLTELAHDDEAVQLSSLVRAHLVPDDDEEEEAPDFSGMDPYSIFISKLKRRSSTDIVKSLQSFVLGIEAELREASYAGSIEDKLKAVADSIWAFLKKTLALMRENVGWEAESADEWKSTRESLEIFLFSKLHKTLFIEDAAGDSELHERIQTLSFLSPEHLDIRSIVGDGTKVLARPVAILREALAAAGSPVGKVQCLRECSAAISRGLTEYKQDGSFAGADEFLPVLILTIKEANPRQLKSNMAYILQFTDPAKLASEAGYLLTQFVSAVQFLETVDAAALTISPLEFEVAVARCRAEARKLSGEFQSRNDEIEKSILNNKDSTVSLARPIAKAAPSMAPAPSAMDILMQRRKHSGLLRSSEHGVRELSSESSGKRVEPSERSRAGGNRHSYLKESRLALLQALNAYDSSLHSDVLGAWSGVSIDTSIKERESAGDVSGTNTAVPVLNFVTAPVETLHMADVPKLLAEYKCLAKICAVLISERMDSHNLTSS